MEGHWEGPRVETSKGPLWQVAVEGDVYGGSLAFLGSTRVGCISVRRRVPEEAAEAGDMTGSSSGDEGEESGPGPPRM